MDRSDLPIEGTLLWQPSLAQQQNSTLHRYMNWLEQQHGLHFHDYAALWEWSVRDLPGFWASIWEFFDVHATQPATTVLSDSAMPGAHWFPGATLNYAEHVFRQQSAEHPALIFQSETQAATPMSWQALHAAVASVAAALREIGIGPGDRVVAYLPNIPQAVIALLACASLGAIWSSCSPDMGAASVADRFRQVEPKVLFAVDGYRYAGKPFDRRAMLADLQQALPTLQQTILVPYLDRLAAADTLPNTVLWETLLGRTTALHYAAVPFEHPLWVLYSSGTTGLPKPIIQSHGGILLEHLKSLALHLDLHPGNRFFWFTTTSWMMWNFLVGGLLVGTTILLYDGSPGEPDLGVLWRFAEQTRMTFFGTSAAYIQACMKAGIRPGVEYDLRALQGVGSTGSPLAIDGFAWVYKHIHRDIWLASISGGSDVCTAFVGGCPILPVYAGEIQARCLGARVEIFDDQGNSVIDQVGELVLTAPMPSMPTGFWNDPDRQRYRESYFEHYPGIWRHGDWAKITRRGGVVIYGRSDATINRMGIRMGTSELYRAIEGLPEIRDSLVIDLELLGRPSFMALFVVLNDGNELDQQLIIRINTQIRQTLSPRHLPDAIYRVPEVPRTLNGKKMETPIKRILLGVPPEKAANRDSMANPESLSFFVTFAASLK